MDSNPSNKYTVFIVSQTTHKSDVNTDTYGFNLFAIGRLDDTLENNRLSVQSICKEQLQNIIKTFCDKYEIDIPVVTYTPFYQKFVDLTAGVYASVNLTFPASMCYEDFE